MAVDDNASRATDEQIKKASALLRRIDLKNFSVCQFTNPGILDSLSFSSLLTNHFNCRAILAFQQHIHLCLFLVVGSKSSYFQPVNPNQVDPSLQEIW